MEPHAGCRVTEREGRPADSHPVPIIRLRVVGKDPNRYRKANESGIVMVAMKQNPAQLARNARQSHFHSARRSLMSFTNAAMARMSVSRNSVVFSLSERTGNIWMATLGR